MRDYYLMRHNMVKSQLLPNGVHRPDLVHAFLETPRELFLPAALQAFAYTDQALRIASDRVMMQPLLLAWFLDKTPIQEGQKILVVGGMMGYAAVLLSYLCHYIDVWEPDSILLGRCVENLKHLGIHHVHPLSKPSKQSSKTPYDLVFIESGTPEDWADSLPAHHHLAYLCTKESVSKGVLRSTHHPHFIDKILFEACGCFEWTVFSKHDEMGTP